MNTDIEPSQETQNEWNNDPDNWIWGFLYYNPKDSRLLNTKRIKELGWTINFANPNSVFLVIIFITILLIIGESTT